MTKMGRGQGEFGTVKLQDAEENNPVTVDVAAHGQDSTYTIPDTGAAAADFVMDEGAQTIAGVKAFTGANTHAGVETFSAMFKVPTATVAAAGSTQGDAGALATGFTLVSGADATKGVVLPTAAAGLVAIVKNGANAVLKVYPATSDAINALSADASLDIAAYTSVLLVAYDATTWYSVPLLPS